MKKRWAERIAAQARLVQISARLLASRRYWIVPAIPLTWSAIQALFLAMGWREEGPYQPVDAQTIIIGFPLTVLAIGLGVRVIIGEAEKRTLEIAYTVPGGAHRVWVAKLVAAVLLVAASEALLAIVAVAFFTGYPPAALYGAFQAAVFYMVLAMALATLFKSEVTGAMVTVLVVVANGFFTGFGGNQLRISPFWNPLVFRQEDASDVLAWTVQNRIGFALAIAALIALAFARAERRETMLSS